MPERILTINGTMRQVGKVLAMAAREHGERTLRDIAGLDLLEQERRAKAWRTLQEQIEGNNDKKKE